jgi:threonine aldolase
VETNIVNVDLGALDEATVSGRLWDRGVRVLPMGPNRLRAVTHLGVDREGIERAIEAFRSAVAG